MAKVCAFCTRKDGSDCICSADLRCRDSDCLWYLSGSPGKRDEVAVQVKRKATMEANRRAKMEGTDHTCALPDPCSQYPHLNWACKKCELIWGRCWRAGVAFWRRDWRANLKFSEGDTEYFYRLLQWQGELDLVDIDVTRAGDPGAEATNN